MDKRSFYFLFTVLAASMLIMGTYKVTKKKAPSVNTHNQSTKVIK
ncbi:hypothetical protein HDF26_004876 [Pedobacter cryoconitis]|uniref:Uncharacterized protein n=1 Tax=Pedobacter cryoconitis TaxID=188932 RepID=A0A7W8ZRJ9_9SPHI|nr:hypothetical protein [Pedobacter cryoconitis]MBB5638660.1 hypothetical protein [Pedobacter cryoconitis]MBB6274402.1 hypothetical protein [Pedobacter cryoconitis]